MKKETEQAIKRIDERFTFEDFVIILGMFFLAIAIIFGLAYLFGKYF